MSTCSDMMWSLISSSYLTAYTAYKNGIAPTIGDAIWLCDTKGIKTEAALLTFLTSNPLKPIPGGSVFIDSTPSDATVYILSLETGEMIWFGKTPILKSSYLGWRDILISKSGYVNERITVFVDEYTTVNKTLKRFELPQLVVYPTTYPMFKGDIK